MESMYYIGLDVHKKTISYCIKDGSGKIHSEGRIPATRCRSRLLDEEPSPALERGDGSHHVHKLDLPAK